MKFRIDLKILIGLMVALGILPIFSGTNLYVMNILTMCLIWGVVVSAWDLIMGTAGIFTFAQIALFAVGGYVSAMICIAFGISPWLGMLIGGILAAAIGVLVSLPCLKLKGSYVALVTFAFHMLVEQILKSDLGIALGTGGPRGIMTIPPFKIGNYEFTNTEPVAYFYVALTLAIVFFLIMYWIIHSPLGMAFVTLRDSEIFAKSIGINDYKYKVLIFGISAFITGVMGAFYAHYVGMMSTRTVLGLELFLFLVLMLIAGGMGRFPGGLLGTIIIYIVGEFLRPLEAYRMLIFGALIVIFVLRVPQGALGILYDMIEKRKGYQSQF